MISDPAELQPHTHWADTTWAHTPENSLVDHQRKTRLCPATLLPFKDQKPDWAGFKNSIRWMLDSARDFDTEITFVLNADTGYIFQLDLALYREVITRFRAAFPNTPIICGITSTDGSYLPQLEIAQSFDSVEVMLMTSPELESHDTESRRDAYFEILEHVRVPAIVHALEPAFVPWATPFSPWLLHELANHPKVAGGKISTLDEPHFLYWAAMTKDLDLPFSPHCGDDYGIATAIRCGLPLLIGAGVSACPLICAAKHLWLEPNFDPRVYKLFEAIQSLEDTVFRLDPTGSAAAYKHSTAVCLQLLGIIAADEIHPACPDRRPENEPDRMREALQRPLRIAERLNISRFDLTK
ncbi:MAG: hypothetical protein AAF591_13155 [Verrucomicrobiota bacterium]